MKVGSKGIANSANRRVLVTDDQGNERGVEGENDLGLDGRNTTALKARLQGQGVTNMQQVGLYGGMDNLTPAKTTSNPYLQNQQNAGSSSVAAVLGRPQTAPVSNLSSARYAPVGGQRRPTTAGSGGANANRSPPPADVQLLVKKVKETLRSRGATGMIGVQRTFRIMDDDGSKTLSFAEFKKAMKDQCKFTILSDNDLRKLFDYFDTNGSGTIEYEEFIQGIRDPLNASRRGLIELA